MEVYREHPHHHHRLRKSGLFLVLRDLLLLCAALNVFALFHHVLPVKLEAAGSKRTAAMTVSAIEGRSAEAISVPVRAVDSAIPAADSAAATAVPAANQPPMPTPLPGDFSATFPTEDTGADALYSYQTDTVRVAIQKIQAHGVTYFLADVYVKNIDAFKTAFAEGIYGKNIHEFPVATAADNGAVFAVTGDYYSAHSKGIVIRNGELYRDVPGSSVCVLYQNGEMKTYAGEAPDLSDFEDLGIWQAWSFGPALLDEDGNAIQKFTSGLSDRHPRCGIGYYAPGHYCFIVVDGRQKGYSVGVRLTEFSAMFAELGCTQAYNLDGGATAIMMFQGEVINQPSKGGRESGDIIYFQ